MLQLPVQMAVAHLFIALVALTPQVPHLEVTTQNFLRACNARSPSLDPVPTTITLWRGHRDVIHGSAPVHATLAQPAAGADALKDLCAARPRNFSLR
jgi:hypothetical protein